MTAKVCDGCKEFLIDLLDKRIGRILEIARVDESYSDTGQSHCFHLMEIKRILEGKPTSGVYDDYGKTKVEGPTA